MYAMTGKLIAQAGKRGQLIGILLEASRVVAEISECLQYVISEDIADESVVWIFEIWNDKEAHDRSLKNEQVRLLISQAMPLIASAPSSAELNIAGGHGI